MRNQILTKMALKEKKELLNLKQKIEKLLNLEKKLSELIKSN